MPEGDNIYYLARHFSDSIAGLRVSHCRIGRLYRRPAPHIPADQLTGRTVTSVRSNGKHLLMDLDEHWCLSSHLGMYGTWHRYRRGESWRLPPRLMSVQLDFEQWHIVCFRALSLKLTRQGEIYDRNFSARLGPDLAVRRDAGTLDHIIQRIQFLASADTLIMDLLLDQRIAAGLGNVYKSELLFLHRIPPMTSIEALSVNRCRALFDDGGRLLRANLGPGRRRTRFTPDRANRLWVYNRAGEPCYECGTPIRTARLGKNHRPTFWCPACQDTLGAAWPPVKVGHGSRSGAGRRGPGPGPGE